MKNQQAEIIQEFEGVRQWGKIRGIDGASADVQLQRFFQEAIEIHKAMIENDEEEFIDSIGDTIVTLINLAKTKGYNAEDCLEKAFGVIELRKGLNQNGSFNRYAKLSDEDKKICDEKQGNPGDQYFEREMLNKLEPKDFLK